MITMNGLMSPMNGKVRWGWLGVLLLSIGTAWCQQEGGKLDPLLWSYLLSPQLRAQAVEDRVLSKTFQGERIEAIVTLSGAAADFTDPEVRVRWQKKGLAIVELPVDRLKALAALPQVVQVAANDRANLCTDISVKEIGALQARQTNGWTGKNVLIGFVDSGIDFRHADFRRADGTTRIKSMLDLSLPGDYYSGAVYTEAEINATLAGSPVVEEADERGHGSHVAGIAAGDGSRTATYGDYAGVAPEADLVVVKATRGGGEGELSVSDQLIAIGFIDSIATTLGEPCVTNLSFGTNMGAHDGTAAVERMIDETSGPGRLFVVAAGNQTDEGAHALVNLRSGSGQVTFNLPTYVPSAGKGNDDLILDGWYEGTGELTATLVSPSGKTFGPASDGQYVERNTTEGYILLLNGFHDDGEGYFRSGRDPFNSDKQIILNINDTGSSGNPAQGTWTLKLSGSASDVHFWMANNTMSAVFVKGLSSQSTISIPATAKKAIAVGAYTTRESWKDLDGNNLTIDTDGTIRVGDIAAFSGAGPTRDGRSKPDVTAPGQIIASTMSADAPATDSESIFYSPTSSFPNAFVMPDSVHGLSMGTSMAAPHVSGLCAMVLQKYPQATPEQVVRLLRYTARDPGFSGNANQWGAGKIDALTATTIDIEDVPENPDSTISESYVVDPPFPNPFSGTLFIQYTLPRTYQANDRTELKIYNIRGQLVRMIPLENLSIGVNSCIWDGRDAKGRRAASGVYLIEFRSGKFSRVRKVTLIRSQS